MFFITGMSTFTWVLLAYIGLHLGADYVGALRDLSLQSVVLIHHIGPDRDFILRVREVFLIVGSLALFIEIAKAATASNLEHQKHCLALLSPWFLLSCSLWSHGHKMQLFLFWE